MDSDTGRAMWLTISMGSMSGASHQTGPMKCLKYLGPCATTPKTWVRTKTSRASATLVLSVAVGGRKPGMSDSRLQKRMKRKRVPMSGR